LKSSIYLYRKLFVLPFDFLFIKFDSSKRKVFFLLSFWTGGFYWKSINKEIPYKNFPWRIVGKASQKSYNKASQQLAMTKPLFANY
jgi:hypothetical protein